MDTFPDDDKRERNPIKINIDMGAHKCRETLYMIHVPYIIPNLHRSLSSFHCICLPTYKLATYVCMVRFKALLLYNQLPP